LTHDYAENFCEENVWRFLRTVEDEEAYAVFISTANRNCHLYAQRPAINPNDLAIWDYHVVALVHREEWLVYDFDSLVSPPAPAQAWTAATFPFEDNEVRFRLVPVAEFLRHFRSDRRHLRTTAPDWPPISPGESNLNDYTNVTADSPGRVIDLAEWKQICDAKN